ncbi:zinc finger protein 177-like isoform X1 [Daphnia magna]|uniref:C2H2-type domain-containing protein n=1 Tax=Daphnia magna TaxID=35525 RepID=A0ABR0AEA9_9CRUS|nr:zinc finger protein 177 isoform X1 [Daphnia magna]XP_045027229.1 zinc finger protein 177 isoform X1 [Daphnia magna]XP_045027660.1 zinc finger protein 177-like isoform X1 [Daphnia magna]KAK4023456.1 hypothetical protein OUZ56_008866 [Daphnia magna]
MYTDRKMARVKHKHKSALQTAVSFSHSKCTNKNPNLVTPCYTKIKAFSEHKDTREIKRSGKMVEYESCCIDGFVIYSFATVEEQHKFSPSTALEVFPSAIIPKAIDKTKILEEITNIDCEPRVEKNEDVTCIRQKNTCASCGKAFVFLSTLEFHLRSTIPKDSVILKCEFCPHLSYGSDTMRMHVRHLHGERLYDQFSSDELRELFDEQIPPCRRNCSNASNI